jgi:hypothetical protein
VLVGVELGNGENGALVRGVVQGRDFHQPPADDAEDIAEASGDSFRLAGVELALARKADAEDEIGCQQ